MIRKTLATLVVVLFFILLPVPAPATFHLMKIVEVFPGTSAEPTAQYVMLQMYSPGQIRVARHSVSVFDATGTPVGTSTFASGVANGANLATILIATSDAAALFGVTADLMMTPVIPTGGGAVCYDVIDCVTWGSFSAAGALPVPPETPSNAPTGLILDMAMHRNLSSGGAVTNFAFAFPAPRNNAGTIGMLGATPTPIGTPTPAVTPSLSPCVGDCDGSGDVTVNELITMVSIALGNTPLSACTAGDPDGSGDITINEIIAAVNDALNGCPVSPEQQGCLTRQTCVPR